MGPGTGNGSAGSPSGSARATPELTAKPFSAPFRRSKSRADIKGHSGTLAQARGLAPGRLGSDVVDSAVLEADGYDFAVGGPPIALSVDVSERIGPTIRVSGVTPDDA